MERVVREKQLFGGLVGEALYEVLRNQRRLRDDLYYRLIRGGEIQIPELRERPEDIPILFYFMIETEFRLLMPRAVQDNWEVELPVYEELMNPSLQWEGNLRELQAATRRIVIAAVDEYEAAGSQPAFLLISGAHARLVLRQHRTAEWSKMDE
jgi:transcriptional regulator with PAS, ATPase and Fis domain